MIVPCAIGASQDRMAPTASRPMPGHEKIGLDHDRAAEQEADLQADQGHDGDQGVAQRVPQHDGPLREAFRPRGADVVGAENVEDGAARHPGDRPDEDAAERRPPAARSRRGPPASRAAPCAR